MPFIQRTAFSPVRHFEVLVTTRADPVALETQAVILPETFVLALVWTLAAVATPDPATVPSTTIPPTTAAASRVRDVTAAGEVMRMRSVLRKPALPASATSCGSVALART